MDQYMFVVGYTSSGVPYGAVSAVPDWVDPEPSGSADPDWDGPEPADRLDAQPDWRRDPPTCPF